MYDEEYKEITAAVDKLLVEANAKCVYLVDKDGQLITSSGETRDIGYLWPRSQQATSPPQAGFKLIGEKEFSILFHEGERDNLHISVVGQRVILVVIFDKRSSLGLVRLRARRRATSLAGRYRNFVRMEGWCRRASLQEITDDDIEKLFTERIGQVFRAKSLIVDSHPASWQGLK